MASEGGKTTRTHYFWGSESPFSNFYDCGDGFDLTIETAPGVIETQRFYTSEHAFMYCKAKYFGDHEAAALVIKAYAAKEAKAIGRKVRGFNEKKWTYARWAIMYNCVYAKFWGCADAWAAMKRKGDCEYAEASPYDRIWGIGYRYHDAEKNRRNWGANLLGKIMKSVYEGIASASDSDRPPVLKLHKL